VKLIENLEQRTAGRKGI